MEESSNVFKALGIENAEEQRTKVWLAVQVNRVIRARAMRQADVSITLGIPQPRVSSLVNYKLDHFSVERLLEFLTMLGQNVEIVITPTKRKGAGTVTVRSVRCAACGVR
jgi:predicted XRE-type DNA-binding protein